jgi:hypothetical protein
MGFGGSQGRGLNPFKQAEVTTDPAAVAGTGQLYWKDTGSGNEFYLEDESANVIQVTNAGALNVPAGIIVDGGNSESANVTIGTNDAYALNLETNGATRATITSAGEFQIPTGLDLVLKDDNELQFGSAGSAYWTYMKWGANGGGLADDFICHIGSVGASFVGEIGFKTQGYGETFLYLDPCPACNQNYARLGWTASGGNGPIELRAIRKHSVNSLSGEVLLSAEGTTNTFGDISASLSVRGDHGITSLGAWYDATTATATGITLDYTNRLVTVDASGGAITITLPTIAAASPSLLGCRYDIKKIDSSGNAVTIDGAGAETIDGATTQSLASQFDSISISAGATEWHIW